MTLYSISFWNTGSSTTSFNPRHIYNYCLVANTHTRTYLARHGLISCPKNIYDGNMCKFIYLLNIKEPRIWRREDMNMQCNINPFWMKTRCCFDWYWLVPIDYSKSIYDLIELIIFEISSEYIWHISYLKLRQNWFLDFHVKFNWFSRNLNIITLFPRIAIEIELIE